MASSLMPLDRDTERCPRTWVLAVITRRSGHCSLLHTHKPGSPLLLCSARTPLPLRRSAHALNCSKTGPLSPRTSTQNPEIPNF